MPAAGIKDHSFKMLPSPAKLFHLVTFEGITVYGGLSAVSE
jgi:hypothetical protein